MIDTCEIRVTDGEAEIAQNQIPSSALSKDSQKELFLALINHAGC
jgi:hypothetical protein